MKRSGYIERNNFSGTCPGKADHGLFNRSLSACNHNLSRAVIVRDITSFNIFYRLLDDAAFQSDNRRHSALSGRNRACHKPSPDSCDSDRILKTHGSGNRQRAILSERQSRRNIRPDAFCQQALRHYHARRDKRGLRILGYIDLFMLFEKQCPHIEVRRRRRFVQHQTGAAVRQNEVLRHSYLLYTLTRITKCNFHQTSSFLPTSSSAFTNICSIIVFTGRCSLTIPAICPAMNVPSFVSPSTTARLKEPTVNFSSSSSPAPCASSSRYLLVSRFLIWRTG